jgi:peptide deformylase
MVHSIDTDQSVLENPSDPIVHFDDGLNRLVADLFETLYAIPACALAAPEIGIPYQVCVIDLQEGASSRLALVNPVILSVEGKQVHLEGCLALRSYRAKVARPNRITVRARDVQGQQFDLSAEGLLARTLCHEIDHLNGVLLTSLPAVGNSPLIGMNYGKPQPRVDLSDLREIAGNWERV